MASVQDSWFLAAKQGRDDDVKELIKQIDVNTTDQLGNTALHYAAGANHLSTIKILVTAPKVNVNKKDKVGDTALHKAAFKGSEEVVQALVDAGADINAKNNQGQKPSDVAKTSNVHALLGTSKKLWDDGYHSGDEEKKEDDDDEGWGSGEDE
eukprot:TRINITY_DN623_c0_g1_i1.p1 TRINITY_DN623_c0_g1~~TRINITY_DN623_c0_g1_i1.p1  ORF type:complete len:153 (+),score=56.23 TRINITY_DN623_c0_g1_i1:40-498(+)